VGVVAGERADAAGGRGTRGGGSGDSVCEEEGGGTRVRVFVESILKNIFYFLHHIFYFIVYYFLIFLFIIF
jgi:hypothetical protein